MTSPIDLSGRKILITGAAGGIGAATAKLCAEQGADLVLVDVLPVEAIRERVGEVAGAAAIHSCDTSLRQNIEALRDKTGAVYGLIDCAAICPEDDWLGDTWDEVLERTLAINIKGPANLARTYFPLMLAQGEGRIVLLGSVAGWMGGLRSGAPYALSKGAIHAFTRWLAQRGAAHNVLVNAIAPGPVDTDMIAGRGYKGEAYPLKRLARPEELAAVALFLCGPGASYTTGAVWDVNGATHLR